jgi:hypothetical protein
VRISRPGPFALEAPTLALLATAGCSELHLDPIHEGHPPVFSVVSEEFVQSPLPEVDLLLVIDDAPTMASAEEALADQVGSLVAGLAGIAWQLGVVSMDVEAADSGMLVGSPYVLTPDLPYVETALADRMRLGADDPDSPAGFASALATLSLAGDGGVNGGFRRPDAALHVVFVADADDASGDALGTAPEDAESTFLADLLDYGASSPPVVSAIVGEPPDGCSSESGSASPGIAFSAAASATGGSISSICAADFGPILELLAANATTFPRIFPLQADPSYPAGQFRVWVDGVPALGGWSIDHDLPALVFDVPPAGGAVVVATYVTELG